MADPLEGWPSTRAARMDRRARRGSGDDCARAARAADSRARARGRRDRRLRPPGVAPAVSRLSRSRSRPSAAVFARYCVGCHVIDGDGGTDGPDLTHDGQQARRRDAAPLDRRSRAGRSGRRDAVVRRSPDRPRSSTRSRHTWRRGSNEAQSGQSHRRLSNPQRQQSRGAEEFSLLRSDDSVVQRLCASRSAAA